MELRRVLLVCMVFFSAASSDIASVKQTKDSSEWRLLSHGGAGQLMVPLLLRIAGRLGVLVSTSLTGLLGIFLFVFFAKKAFLISLFTLLLTYIGRQQQSEDDSLIPIHKIKIYDDDLNSVEHIYHGGWRHKKRRRRPSSPYRSWSHRRPHPSFQTPHRTRKPLRYTRMDSIHPLPDFHFLRDEFNLGGRSVG